MSRPVTDASHRPTVGLPPPAGALADEEAADAARNRYRAGELVSLAADRRIAPLLMPDEHVLAVHHSAAVDRRESAPRAQITAGVRGVLYVTSKRIVVLGRTTVEVELGKIDEAVLAGERLRLILSDGRGVTLKVARPRLLRVQIAAARASVRGMAPS